MLFTKLKSLKNVSVTGRLIRFVLFDFILAFFDLNLEIEYSLLLILNFVALSLLLSTLTGISLVVGFFQYFKRSGV